jgi:hypothetical protein
MAYHIDPSLTPAQHRQNQAYVDDLRLEISTGAAKLAGLSRETNRTIAAEAAATREEISAQAAATRDEIAAEGEATRETLVEGFTALGQVNAAGFRMLDEATRQGFETIHLDLRENTEAVWAVSSTLEIGFAHIDTRLGALATSFNELIRIAKTPEQT